MRRWVSTLFFLLFIGLILGVNIYLGSRFSTYFQVENTVLMSSVFTGIMISMFAGVGVFLNSTRRIGTLLFGIAAITMGLYMYTLLGTLVVDLVGLFVGIPPLTSGMIVLGIAALISLYGIIHANTTKVYNVDIKLEGLTRPIRAVHLTDTHLGHFRGAKTLQKIVNKINELDVEVVFFTGDLLDSTKQLKEESMAPLKSLKAPIYFVAGNHDEYTGVRAIKDYLKSIGVRVLENEVATWGELQIVGLNYMMADASRYPSQAVNRVRTIQSTLPQLPIDPQKTTLLMHHGPDGIQYAHESGVDLYLCGHTHGGQMWPATYVARMMFPFNKGLSSYKDTQIYVSQGTGTFGPPMRVGTDSELTVLTLRGKSLPS